MKINIEYITNYKDKKDILEYEKFLSEYKAKIEKMLNFALEIEKINVNSIYLGISVVTEQEIKKINMEYRNVDSKTDVLSFPMFDREEIIKLREQGEELDISLGDIVLCLPVIEGHAVEYGTGFNREMIYMITHGICHLLGYDHENEQDKKEMRRMEEHIIKEAEVE